MSVSVRSNREMCQYGPDVRNQSVAVRSVFFFIHEAAVRISQSGYKSEKGLFPVHLPLKSTLKAKFDILIDFILSSKSFS